MQIKDINAVVTGGASGLGLATATRLVESGATVTLLDLPGSAGAEQAAALGPVARFVPTDVTDGAAVAAAFAAAAERGPVRAVVHCAGADDRCACSPRTARPPTSSLSSR